MFVNISKTCESFPKSIAIFYEANMSPQVLQVVHVSWQQQSWHVRLSYVLASLVQRSQLSLKSEFPFQILSCSYEGNSYSGESLATQLDLSRNIWTPEMYGPPRSKYFEIFGPPLKYLDRVRSACCSRVVNCTKNGRTRFVSSWDDTLLTSDMIKISAPIVRSGFMYQVVPLLHKQH